MYDVTSLAHRLLLSRRDVKWNQEELAIAAGISRPYISQIERGVVTNVGIDVISALAKALEVSPEYLAGWQEDPLNRIPDEDERVLREERPLYQVFSDEERALIEDVRKLSEEHRRLLRKFVQLLIEETPV
jgi:transcriptional regulator with XRE-family HTH domain